MGDVDKTSPETGDKAHSGAGDKSDGKPIARSPGLLSWPPRFSRQFWRKVAIFLGLFALSLLIGHICELLFKRSSLERAYHAQSQWIGKLRQMTPLTLAKNYWADFGPAQQGEWIYQAPLPHLQASSLLSDPVAAAEINEAASKDLACQFAIRASILPPLADCSTLVQAPHRASLCRSDLDPTTRELFNCDAFLACTHYFEQERLASSPECVAVRLRQPNVSGLNALTGGDAGMSLAERYGYPDQAAAETEHKKIHLHPIFVPFAAFVRTCTRIFSGGLWNIIWAGAQIGMGFLAWLLLSGMLDKKPDKMVALGGPLGALIIPPIATILFGSLIAFGLQWLMLGSLYLFHAITGFAAAAAGATGIGGFCWYCFTKLSEKGIEGVVIRGKA